jgi:hypothetical protein
MDSTLVTANIKHLSRIQLLHKITVNFIESLSEEKRIQIDKNTLQLFTDKEKLIVDGGYHSSSNQDLSNSEDVEIITTNLTGRNLKFRELKLLKMD